VDGECLGQIESGILVYLGVSARDTESDIDYCVSKVVNLRIFPDEAGKMNLSLLDTGKGIMVVSQFTLYGDMRKGRRPSFDAAAAPEVAEAFYRKFLEKLRAMDLSPREGRFQAHMDVRYVNDGPVTILIDSEKIF
jgi:D-tyrosyl-tRNA(Tyr) deacylase